MVTDTQKKKQKSDTMRQKQARVKETIMNEAERIFSENAFDDVSVDEIAKAALVSRRTLYNYFKQGKDDVFYAVGNRIISEENKEIDISIPQNASGKEQIMYLSEKRLRNAVIKPMELKSMYETYRRFYVGNRSSSQMYDSIVEKLGLELLQELIKNVDASDDFDFGQHFDEPYLYEHYIQFLKYNEYWIKASEKGMQDKSIKTDMPGNHILQFVTTVINGVIYDVSQRTTALKRHGIEIDTIINNTLKLIDYFLENKSV